MFLVFRICATTSQRRHSSINDNDLKVVTLLKFIYEYLIEMKVPRLLLSDLYISEISCPSDKSHMEVCDSDLRGFYVDVMARGRKSFRLSYKFEKKLRVVTLGDSQILTADEVRQLALKLLK